MNRIGRNLSIILRTERLIARRRMAILRAQTGLVAFAGLMAGLGAIMLNVAAFYALSTRMSPQAAALIVALANMLLAAILVLTASRIRSEPELKPALELRDLAISELEADFEETVTEIRDLTSNVRKIARDPLSSVLPALLGPLLAALLRSTRK